MNPWDFISKPNNCDGCPIVKMAPLAGKVANLCAKFQSRYEVVCSLNDYGQQICRIRKRTKDEGTPPAHRAYGPEG